MYREREREREKDREAFAVTFNPNIKYIFPLTQTAFKLLQQSCETIECFKTVI